MENLTDKQKEFLEFLRRNPEATESEIRQRFGFSTRRAVWVYVEALEKKKALRRPKVKRTPWRILV